MKTFCRSVLACAILLGTFGITCLCMFAMNALDPRLIHGSGGSPSSFSSGLLFLFVWGGITKLVSLVPIPRSLEVLSETEARVDREQGRARNRQKRLWIQNRAAMVRERAELRALPVIDL
jgi:hypothetical protein